jgi:hypothetical protein
MSNQKHAVWQHVLNILIPKYLDKQKESNHMLSLFSVQTAAMLENK